MRPTLERLEKAVAWFAIINGVMTFVALFTAADTLPLAGLIGYFALGIGSIVAGCFGLRGRIWAYCLLLVVFLVQLVEYHSSTFFFSFVGPLSLKFGWAWSEPSITFNINILAVVVCSLAFHCAASLAERSRRWPSAPADKLGA